MNQVTTVVNKAPITFSTTNLQILIDVYYTRISFPDNPIILGAADIKACFRFPQIHANLTGAFGFNAGGYFNLATAMVFGSKASASSWEPFCRAIEALSVVYANPPNLVTKHKKYLDMIQWATINPSVKLRRATACSINNGVLDKKGVAKMRPAIIVVEDSLLLAIF